MTFTTKKIEVGWNNDGSGWIENEFGGNVGIGEMSELLAVLNNLHYMLYLEKD